MLLNFKEFISLLFLKKYVVFFLLRLLFLSFCILVKCSYLQEKQTNFPISTAIYFRITSLSDSSWRPVGCFLALTSFGEIVTCWALIIMTPRFSSCLGFYYFLLLYFFHYSTSSLPPTLLLFFWWPELKLSLAEIMVCSCAHHLLIPDSFPLFMLSTQIVAATGKTN